MRLSRHFLFYGRPGRDARFLLDPDESRHALSVLRVKPGDMLSAADGGGIIFECRVDAADKTGVGLTIVSRRDVISPAPRLHCFVGMPEKDAFERILDVLGPLDIAELTPVVCDCCQDPWWKSSWEKQSVRFRKKIIAGLKQSLNPRLPVLHAPVAFDKAPESPAALLIHADADGDKPLGPVLLDAVVGRSRVDCWIGPPGGFSEREIRRLRERTSLAVSLGPYRLRTETAVTVLCGAVRCLWAPTPEYSNAPASHCRDVQLNVPTESSC